MKTTSSELNERELQLFPGASNWTRECVPYAWHGLVQSKAG